MKTKFTYREFEEAREELLKKLEQLDKAEKEFLALPPIQKFTDFLHNFLCTLNHIDECSYTYSVPGKPSDSRKMWTEKAMAILKYADELGLLSSEEQRT